MTDYDRNNPEVLEDEIERSRERISSDIDQLGQRLKPHHLKERAQDALEDKAKRAGHRLIELIRRNPLPAIGAGVAGLLLFARGRRSKKTSRPRASRRKSRRRP
jgi:ElaB/YqjD/DUF883 family membrane-anchored ribosome-binding protein